VEKSLDDEDDDFLPERVKVFPLVYELLDDDESSSSSNSSSSSASLSPASALNSLVKSKQYFFE